METGIELYTDGAARNNGKKNSVAGWGWCIVADGVKFYENSGRIDKGTNNQGELQAIIEGLSFIQTIFEHRIMPKVTVYSDSSYCIKGITEWIHNWKKYGWYRNKQQTQELKNKELWKTLDQLSHNIRPRWVWVKGHDGNMFNEYVDRLAVAQTKGVK